LRRSDQSDARPVRLVDVLGGLGVKLEGGEHKDLRLGPKRLRLVERELDLPLFQRRVLGAERHHNALRFIFFRLGIRM
jgi:hypothetical protein